MEATQFSYFMAYLRNVSLLAWAHEAIADCTAQMPAEQTLHPHCFAVHLLGAQGCKPLTDHQGRKVTLPLLRSSLFLWLLLLEPTLHPPPLQTLSQKTALPRSFLGLMHTVLPLFAGGSLAAHRNHRGWSLRTHRSGFTPSKLRN